MSNEKGIYFPSTGERTNEALTAALEKERIKARSWRQQFDEQISRRARGGNYSAYGTGKQGHYEAVGMPDPLGPNAFRITNAESVKRGLGQISGDALGRAGSVLGRDEAALAQSRFDAASSRAALLAAANSRTSAAGAQLARAQEQAQAGSLSLARSGRTVGAQMSGMRAAMRQNAAMQQQAGRDSAILRAQEEQARAGLLGQVAGLDQGAIQRDLGARGQTEGYAMGLQGLGAQTLQQKIGVSQAQQQAAAEKAKIDLATRVGINTTNAQFANYKEQGKDNAGAVAGAIAGVAGSAAMMLSDVRAKQGIRPLAQEEAAMSEPAIYEGGDPIAGSIQNSTALLMAAGNRLGRGDPQLGKAAGEAAAASQQSFGKRAQEMARRAPGYSYEYTPEAKKKLGAPDGRQIGPMAQDLESTPLGRSLVSEGKDGAKRVDTGRAALAGLAGLSAQQRQLDRVQSETAAMQRQLEALSPTAMPGAPSQFAGAELEADRQRRLLEALRPTTMPTPTTPAWLQGGY